MRQKLIKQKEEIDESTTIVGGAKAFSQKQTELVGRKSVKDTVKLNITINQPDLTDIYGLLHHQQQNTHPSPAHNGTFAKRDHILVHKANANKWKIIQITKRMFFHHNEIKLKISDRKTIINGLGP